jgi:uncharacterized membrane protein YraQ (UPF0718 family)
VLGAVVAAALSVLVPTSWTETLAGHVVGAIAVLAVLAVLLALCSEADAFVVASLSALPPPCRDGCGGGVTLRLPG